MAPGRRKIKWKHRKVVKEVDFCFLKEMTICEIEGELEKTKYSHTFFLVNVHFNGRVYCIFSTPTNTLSTVRTAVEKLTNERLSGYRIYSNSGRVLALISTLAGAEVNSYDFLTLLPGDFGRQLPAYFFRSHYCLSIECNRCWGESAAGDVMDGSVDPTMLFRSPTRAFGDGTDEELAQLVLELTPAEDDEENTLFTYSPTTQYFTRKQILTLMLAWIERHEHDPQNAHTDAALADEIIPPTYLPHKPGSYWAIFKSNKEFADDGFAPWYKTVDGKQTRPRPNNTPLPFENCQYFVREKRAEHPDQPGLRKQTMKISDLPKAENVLFIMYVFRDEDMLLPQQQPKPKPTPAMRKMVVDAFDGRTLQAGLERLPQHVRDAYNMKQIHNIVRRMDTYVKTRSGPAPTLDPLELTTMNSCIPGFHGTITEVYVDPKKLKPGQPKTRKVAEVTYLNEDAFRAFLKGCASREQLKAHHKECARIEMLGSLQEQTSAYNNALTSLTASQLVKGVAGIIQIDTTFGLSGLYVTLVVGILTHYISEKSKKNRHLILGFLMHSDRKVHHHTGMGHRINEMISHIDPSKFISAYITDGEPSLKDMCQEQKNCSHSCCCASDDSVPNNVAIQRMGLTRAAVDADSALSAKNKRTAPTRAAVSKPVTSASDDSVPNNVAIQRMGLTRAAVDADSALPAKNKRNAPTRAAVSKPVTSASEDSVPNNAAILRMGLTRAAGASPTLQSANRTIVHETAILGPSTPYNSDVSMNDDRNNEHANSDVTDIDERHCFEERESSDNMFDVIRGGMFPEHIGNNDYEVPEDSFEHLEIARRSYANVEEELPRPPTSLLRNEERNYELLDVKPIKIPVPPPTLLLVNERRNYETDGGKPSKLPRLEASPPRMNTNRPSYEPLDVKPNAIASRRVLSPRDVENFYPKKEAEAGSIAGDDGVHLTQKATTHRRSMRLASDGTNKIEIEEKPTVVSDAPKKRGRPRKILP